MNSSNNLVPFANDGLELVIDTNSGESFASQSAVARMCEVSKQAISQWVTVNQIFVIITEINTSTGLKTVKLLNESSIYEALAKYNPKLLINCAKAGLRIYLHKLAGYQVSSTATQPKTPAEMLLASAQMLVDHERQLAQQAKQIQSQDHRLTTIEQRSIEAEADLNQLPPATVEAEKLTTRFALNRLVRGFADAKVLAHQNCWNRLYTEFRDRYHTDLKARGKNAKPKLSGLQYAEQNGHIEQLYAIGIELFSIDK